MREGRLTAELRPRRDASEETIMAAATGQLLARTSSEHCAAARRRARRPRQRRPARRSDSRRLTERHLPDQGIWHHRGPDRVRGRDDGDPASLPQTRPNITFVLINTTVFALLALGQTVVVISRNVDLSVGSVVGLSAYVSASMFGEVQGIPIPVVFLIGLGIGAGLRSGQRPDGLAGQGTEPGRHAGHPLHRPWHRHPDRRRQRGGRVDAAVGFVQIAQASIGGVPYLAIAIAVLIGLGAYYLRSYRSGRELYAIGSSPEAARLAGIAVAKRICTAFAISGAIAGIAGVLWAAEYQTVDSSRTGYELQVIAAVVVGGVAIFGGSGSIVGAAVGALLLSTINSALYVLGISPFWDQAIAGLPAAARDLARPGDRACRLLAALRLRSLPCRYASRSTGLPCAEAVGSAVGAARALGERAFLPRRGDLRVRRGVLAWPVPDQQQPLQRWASPTGSSRSWRCR